MSTVREDHPKFQSQIARGSLGTPSPGIRSTRPDEECTGTLIRTDPRAGHFDFGAQHRFIQTQWHQPPQVLALPFEPRVPPNLELDFEVPAEPPLGDGSLARGDGGLAILHPGGIFSSTSVPLESRRCSPPPRMAVRNDAVFHHAIFTALGTGRVGPATTASTEKG